MDVIGSPPNDGFFVDAFCGTGVVAELARSRGWPIRLNDHLYCALVMAIGRSMAAEDAEFKALGGYLEAIEALNRLPPVHGFIWREYSPASASHAGLERRYFTEANAAQIDAVRRRIFQWRRDGLISHHEESLLIADLLSACNRVANISGTYGCFLKSWTRNAKEKLVVRTRDLKRGAPKPIEVFNGDVRDVPMGPSDVVYLDPPYTKRQYAAYYHILETVAVGDEPPVSGVTGLRPWRSKASDFCYKLRALDAIVGVVAEAPAQNFALSYSSEGHVPLDRLEHALEKFASVEIHDLGTIGRYRPNRTASSAGSAVREYLLILEKSSARITSSA